MKEYIAVEKEQLTRKEMETVLSYISKYKLYDYAIIGAIANDDELIVNVAFKRKKTDEHFSYRAVRIATNNFSSRKQEVRVDLLHIASNNTSLVDEALKWARSKDTIPDLDEIKDYIKKHKKGEYNDKQEE